MAPGVSTAAEEFTVASFDLGTGGTIHPAGSYGTPGGVQKNLSLKLENSVLHIGFMLDISIYLYDKMLIGALQSNTPGEKPTSPILPGHVFGLCLLRRRRWARFQSWGFCEG